LALRAVLGDLGSQRQFRFRQSQQFAHAAFAGSHPGVEGADLGGVQAVLSGVAVAGLAAGFAADLQ
jgi:hypothetical protein